MLDVADRLEIAAFRKASPLVLELSDDWFDWGYLDAIFGKMPARFVAPVADEYREKRQKAGQQAANVWAGEVGQRVTAKGASLAASDAEICDLANRCAEQVQKYLAAIVKKTKGEIILDLFALCESQGVKPPAAKSLPGLLGRLSSPGWWRRQFRRTAGRQIEAAARDLGMVHRRAGIYASHETVARHAEQKRRNAAALEMAEAVNSEGEVFKLSELAALGVSNPSVRFAELMVRVKGMEQFARVAGHVGLFVTMTTPSRMHSRHGTGNCPKNDMFDGTEPREAQSWITRQWARMRAAFARQEITLYGVRVAEPHHDGTPHWHMLLFIAPMLAAGRSAVARVKAIIRRYLLRGDFKPIKKQQIAANIRASRQTIRHANNWAGVIQSQQIIDQRRAEKADGARLRRACDFKEIDWARGSAAGYLVKYLAKNISGERVGADLENDKPATETAGRVMAWASCWGIRQFQIIGGPAVGVWRELRRLKDQPEQGELFAAWEATGSKEAERAPDWGKFMKAQGGVGIPAKDRPIQLWKLEEPGRRNGYGEEAGARVAGVTCAGRATATRDTLWTIRRAEKPEVKREAAAVRRASRRVWGFGFSSRKAAPRTCVNNCTQRTKTGFAGLAENMAGWWAAGNREKVLEIFNHMRELKRCQK